MQQASVEPFGSDLPPLCGWCSGTGEGAAEFSACSACRGRGVALDADDIEDLWLARAEDRAELAADLRALDGAL